MGGIKLLGNDISEDSNSGITGYSIIQANSMDEAKKLVKTHPHLAWSSGCTIEIHETVSMDY